MLYQNYPLPTYALADFVVKKKKKSGNQGGVPTGLIICPRRVFCVGARMASAPVDKFRGVCFAWQ